MILFNLNITMQLFYLTVILFIIKVSIKNIEVIDNKYSYIYLMIISLLLNIIFYGVSVVTIFESFISVSFVSLIMEIYKGFIS